MFRDLIESFEKKREEYERRYIEELIKIIDKYRKKRVENLREYRERALKEIKDIYSGR
ncbi:MAG: hypothetical protein QW366_03555 [Sulfolobales archaeon]